LQKNLRNAVSIGGCISLYAALFVHMGLKYGEKGIDWTSNPSVGTGEIELLFLQLRH
jgi:hypothetical protein